jgi:competence protein ComEC
MMLKLFQQYPFIRFLLPFLLGIVFQSYWNVVSFAVFLSVVAVLLIDFSFISSIKKQYEFRFSFGLGFSLLLFSLAVFLTKLSWEKSDWNIDSAVYLYKARVIDETVLKPKTYLCKVEIVSAEESIYKEVVHKKAMIYLPIDSLSASIVAGDYLLFHGNLEHSMPYSKKQSVAAMGFVRKNNWKLDESEKRYSSIRIIGLQVRRILLNRLEKIIPNQDSYAISIALMFGYKGEMDKTLRQSFANIGAGHVLAVSGLHFSILFGMLYSLLAFLGNSPRSKLIIQLIMQPLIWGFAFITGFSPSVLRAATMMSIWGIGNAFFRKAFTLNTLAIAAFFMLFYNPLYLFDIGFQLSFTAVLFIVLLNPYLLRLYETRNPIIKYGWDLCCVSTSAQIGVLPISIYYFNQFPFIFLLTNLLIIPLVTILLLLIPVSLLLNFLWGAASFLTYPLNKVLDFILLTVKFLDEIPYGSLNAIQIDLGEVFFLFLMIVCTILLFIKKKIVYFYLLLIFAGVQVFYYLCQFIFN